MRLVYLGSPEAAVPPLRAIVDAGHDVVLVVSQPDKRRGRGSQLEPSPVKAAALDLGLPVSDDLNDVFDAAAGGAELGVVVAYGKLLRPNLLDALTFVNLHFSLLPRWRGAAPVERAILAGDHQTGVCLMGLEEGLDTGPVFDVVATAIHPMETAAALRARLAEIGSEMLVRNLEGGRDSMPAPVPQLGEPTYAAKLRPEEFRIDWSQSAEQIARLVRLGVAWTTFRGKRLKVLQVDWSSAEGSEEANLDVGMIPGTLVRDSVTTGTRMLRLVRVQPEGKPAMDALPWSRGVRQTERERFDL